MMWGIFDGEIISILHVIWIGVILLGVYLVNTKKLHIRLNPVKKEVPDFGE
jgi:drug/metabolite transporter (DMT)-like permease